jgi:hypothetical protein
VAGFSSGLPCSLTLKPVIKLSVWQQPKL